jgi:hypothetical protein
MKSIVQNIDIFKDHLHAHLKCKASFSLANIFFRENVR